MGRLALIAGAGLAPTHICTEIGPTPATSAPRLCAPFPHLHLDWARPSHICTGTRLMPATSAPGLSRSPVTPIAAASGARAAAVGAAARAAS